MKKIEKAQAFLRENLHVFECPICDSPFQEVTDFQLSCFENHHFDLSKKGTLHFLMKPVQSDYTREMLLARQRIAQSGFWHPLLNELIQLVDKPLGTHLDVGCGEGAHSDYLKKNCLTGPTLAFDISKEGVNLGAATYPDIFFLVADLAQSPFSENAFDTVLNILSPSNYLEFKRILKPGGQVIKVVPGEHYLKELRAFQPGERQPYSNKDVVDKFAEHYPNYTEKKVHYTFELPKERVGDFMLMTPLGWHIEQTAQAKAQLKNITVDLLILEAKSSN